MTTLNVTNPSTTMPVAICPIARLATPTISNMMFIGFDSWPRATTHTLGGGSVGNLFGPNSSRRRCTSAAASPRVGSTPTCRAVSSADNVCQAMSFIGRDGLLGSVGLAVLVMPGHR